MTSTGVAIVIPAFNEEENIDSVVRNIHNVMEELVYEIIVVDDGSTDATGEKSAAAGARVVTHHHNRGYGSSLKSGIRQAQCDLIVTFDADGQHNPKDILRLLHALDEGFDTVIGIRDKKSFQYTSRMPGKAFLQWIAGFLVGERPQDVNSGLRVFKRADALAYFPILPNGFSFSTTLTLAMLKDAYEVGSIPIRTESRQGRRSSVSIRDGLRTILLIVRIATLFNPLKVFIPVSVLLFTIGFVYAILHIFLKQLSIPDGATLMMLAGAIVFFFGILSDQLASLRRMD